MAFWASPLVLCDDTYKERNRREAVMPFRSDITYSTLANVIAEFYRLVSPETDKGRSAPKMDGLPHISWERRVLVQPSLKLCGSRQPFGLHRDGMCGRETQRVVDKAQMSRIAGSKATHC